MSPAATVGTIEYATAAPPMCHARKIASWIKDRIKGSAKQIVGSLREAVGKAIGDKKTQNDGKAEQIVGEVQNALGSAKDTIWSVISKK
jgi:uncharacterized protein YjbJ (UPF0337 family)